MPIDPISPPMLTADLPGLGGRIKKYAEDFEVEEIPAYEPSGSGDHLYLWLEKSDTGPEFFTKIIADRLKIPTGSIGTAGLKDRYAITRQWVSVPASAESRLPHLDGSGIRLLKHSRHVNKLKPGHSRGNRFRILIRDADRSATQTLDQILQKIRVAGLPNYYGPQRFGRDGSTLDLGFQCLAGKQSKRIRPFLYKFALSAVQSCLFNDYLARRLQEGRFRTVLVGDVMSKWPFGGLFVVEDAGVEQSRFDARETVIAGPMFGSRTFATTGQPAEFESQVLRDHQLSPRSFDHFGKLMGGTRRHNMVYIDDLTSQWEPDGLRLSFSLPSGSYATVLLREIMKTDLDEHNPDEDDNDD